MKTWKKPASKVAKPAQIQPKSQFLFHKNLPPRNFSIMTLVPSIPVAVLVLIKSKFTDNDSMFLDKIYTI